LLRPDVGQCLGSRSLQFCHCRHTESCVRDRHHQKLTSDVAPHAVMVDEMRGLVQVLKYSLDTFTLPFCQPTGSATSKAIEAHLQETEPRFIQQRLAQRFPRLQLSRLGFEEIYPVLFTAHACNSNLGASLLHALGIHSAQMIEPVEGGVETGEILRLPGCLDGLLYIRSGFGKGAEFGVQNGHVQERILVECLGGGVLQRVIEETM
jgi:hypothetical protein